MSENNRRGYDRNSRSRRVRHSRQEERRRRERLRKRRRNRIMIISGAAVILAVIILVIVLAVKGCTSQTKAEEPTEPTSATEAPTQAPTNSSVKEIADNGKEGYYDENSSLYFWDNKAFELFYAGNDSAKQYADAINGYKQKLGSDIKVYDMVVPSHSEFGLCEREAKKISSELGVTSQRNNTTVLYKNLSKDIKSVDIYDALNSHKTEYIYFNTDHHWTALGSYYAYTVFAKSAGITPVQLSAMQKNTINGFLGSLYTNSQADILKNNPDYIDYYTLPGSYTCKLFIRGSSEAVDVSIYNEDAKAGSDTYEVFLRGDNPLTVIDNTDNDTGDKIALVKDSYGNAFAPYLAYNYDEVHVIDYLYFDGNLSDYCKANGIKTVLFLNSITYANSSLQLTAMKSLFENKGTGSYNPDSTSTADTSQDAYSTDTTQSSDDSASSEYSYYESDYSADNSSSNDYSQSDNYSSDNSASDENSGYDYSNDYSQSDDYSYN